MEQTITLKFRANEQRLTAPTHPVKFASNTVNYVRAEFELGDGWSGFDSVRAIWHSKYKNISTVLDSDNSCVVPQEVLSRVSPVEVNLVGSISVNETLTDRLTTFPVIALDVSAMALLNGSETAIITASQFEQFVNDAREQVITEVEATTLDTGYPATVSYSGGVMSFGLPRGDKGETGLTPNITVGQVETLDPSLDAEVYINGTAENPKLNFRIPKGDPGELVIAENGLLVDEDGYFYVNL